MADNDGQGGAAGAGGDGGGEGSAAKTWADSLPEDLRGYAANKGWDSGEKALVGYRQLEQFVGADKAGRGLILPGESSTPEERAEFNRRLGVPDKADAYEVTVPEGFPDPEIGNVGRQLLHKHGIPKAAGEALLKDFIENVSTGHAASIAADTLKFEAEEAALKDSWGADFEKNTEIAKRGAKKLGFDDATIDALEAKAGFAGVIKALHQAGTLLGEGKFVDAGGAGGGAAGTETLEQLQARRSGLVHDKAWSQRYHANEPSARREYDELNRKIAAFSTGA